MDVAPGDGPSETCSENGNGLRELSASYDERRDGDGVFQSSSFYGSVRRRNRTEHFLPISLPDYPCPDYLSKCRDLRRFVNASELVADLQMSLYVVASESPAYLKPYPKKLVPEDERGHATLALLNEELPSVKLLQVYLKEPKLNPNVVNLLHWLFLHNKDTKLQNLPPDNFYNIFQNVRNGANCREPSFLFKVMSSKFSNAECKWQALKGERSSTFAFYRARLCGMHSLLNIGFHPLILKDAGLQLSSDLGRCLNPEEDEESGWCWGKSILGSRLKIVLVAEVLENDQNDDQIEYTVSIPEHLRIRYVLVFSENPHFGRIGPPPERLALTFNPPRQSSPRLDRRGALFILLSLTFVSCVLYNYQMRKNFLRLPTLPL